MTKRILITGAASGIGAEFARLCAAKGHRTIIADIDAAGAARVAKSCGPQAADVALDITSSAQWNAVLDWVWETFGGLDVLVNNAAIVHPGYAEHIPVSAHEATIDVNFMGPMRGMLATLPRFRAQGHGHFVTVASMTAFIPFPGLTSYAAAKNALRAFHLGVATEERHSPIDFTIVHPGATETPMLEREAESDDLALAFAGDASLPVDVAQAILEAMEQRAVEVLFPSARADAVRAVGLDPAKLFAMAERGEPEGLRRLQERRRARP